MSSDRTQATIADQQRKIEALQGQIQQARDRDQADLAAGLESQVKDAENQISSLQTQLNDERKQEAKEAAQEAYKDGKEDSILGKIF